MKHFILTRNSYPDGYPNLEQRAEILRRYVVPSLRAQTVKDFTWVVTSPVGLEGADLSGIDHLVLDQPAPPSFDSVVYLAQQALSELVHDLPAGELVITTRLDNDDMLLPTYVEDVQALAKAEEAPFVVDAPGYRVDARDGRVYRDTFYPERQLPSPFISLVERTVGRGCRIHSAYFDQHTRMHRHFRLVHVERRSWVQLIHDTNKLMAHPQEVVETRGELLPVSGTALLEALREGRDLPFV